MNFTTISPRKFQFLLNKFKSFSSSIQVFFWHIGSSANSIAEQTLWLKQEVNRVSSLVAAVVWFCDVAEGIMLLHICFSFLLAFFILSCKLFSF